MLGLLASAVCSPGDSAAPRLLSDALIPVLQVRFMARSFGVPGDYSGQQSNGFRWPFGRVGLITPFNFPLEIPALQLMGALYMGNKPLLHCDHRWGVMQLCAFSRPCSRGYSRAAAV